MSLHSARFTVASDVHARQFDDELVILDLASGNYFGLNDVGTVFWQRAAAGASMTEVVTALAREYDVDEVRLASDLTALAEQLLDRGLLKMR